MRTLTSRQSIDPFKIPLARDEMNRNTPLSDVVDSFFNSVSGDLREPTRNMYRVGFTHFFNWTRTSLGREPVLSDLGMETVSAFKTWIVALPTDKYPRGSPFRARAAIRSVKRLANWLAEEGDYVGRDGRSVIRRVKMPKELIDVRMPLAAEQVEAILEATPGPPSELYTLCIFALATGLRLNELRELRVSDLNLKERRVQVRAETSKFQRSRQVDFHDSVAKDLDRYLRRRKVIRQEDPLFPADHKDFYTSGGLQKVFQRLSDYCGVEFSEHVFRHTWATNCRLAGMDLLTLKEQGGWARWEMVQRYAHIIPIRDRTTLPDPTLREERQRRGPKVLRFQQRIV